MKNILENKKIILGITGSIAAYKSLILTRLLIKSGADVQVIMTKSAQKFVGKLSFSTLSRHAVLDDLWESSDNWAEHVHLAENADLLLIAPATANSLAKFANGICDNLLSAVYLSARCPVMIAPAMDLGMYAHKSTQRNLAQLKKDSCEIIEAGSGELASGLIGKGRMAEPEDIFKIIETHFYPKILKNKKILISAGPTRENIDPVRFISNHSTGKMGYSIAEAAKNLGAEVVLVSGPTNLETEIQTIQVNSAKEMAEMMLENSANFDIVIMSAAVGDYTPKVKHSEKLKKAENDLTLELERTQDILKTLGERKSENQVLVGFALETQNELENAKRKLSNKNLDFIVLNSLKEKGAGFAHDTNKIHVFSAKGDSKSFPLQSKKELAYELLEYIIETIG